VSGIADPFNGHIDEFRISQIQRSDGWIETTWPEHPARWHSQGASSSASSAPEPPRFR
jgi:hypothetical protein